MEQLSQVVLDAIKQFDFWNNLIQAIALIIAIRSFNTQIKQQGAENARRNEDQISKDARSELKLNILFYCKSDGKKREDIVNYFKSQEGGNVSISEIDKSIYEMLVDETLRYRNNNTFKVRLNDAKTPEGTIKEITLLIFSFCQDNTYTKQEITDHVKSNLTKSVDETKIGSQINEAIYQMVADETLRYRTDGTFKVRRNRANNEG